MVLTVHHLSVSQSERITWLLEELGLPYEIHVYKRDKHTNLGPPDLKALPHNPMQSAPVFHDSDGDITLAESGAIVDFILARYGAGRLAPSLSTAPQKFARYLDWLYRSNASALPAATSSLFFNMAGVAKDDPIRLRLETRFRSQCEYAEKCLGEGKWLAGDEFTAADIVTHFVFNTSRFFVPYSTAEYPNIRRWAADCAARPAFQTAFKKGDADILPYLPLGADAPTEAQKPWKQ